MVCLYGIRSVVNYLYHCNIVNKHKEYITLHDTIFDKAYESVYKAHVVAYSASAIRPENDQLETIKRNYIKLSFQLMGPNLETVLIAYYGNKQTLITAMIVYMETRLDSDVIMDYANKMRDESENGAETIQGLVPENMKTSWSS